MEIERIDRVHKLGVILQALEVTRKKCRDLLKRRLFDENDRFFEFGLVAIEGDLVRKSPERAESLDSPLLVSKQFEQFGCFHCDCHP